MISLIRLRVFALFVVAQICVTSAFAQSVFSIHSEFPSQKKIEVNNVTLLNSPAEAEFSFDFSDSECVGVDEVNITIVSPKGESSDPVKYNNGSFDKIKKNFSEKGKYSIYASIKYRQGIEVEYSDTTITSKTVESSTGTDSVVYDTLVEKRTRIDEKVISKSTDTIFILVLDVVESQSISDNDFTFYSEGTVSLAAKVSGGVDGGWQYSWYKNGSLISDAINSEFTETIKNETKATQDIKYKFVGINSYYSKQWAKIEYTYNVKIYAEAYISNSNISAQEVLTGKNVTASISVGGAKEGGWSYQWYLDNSPLDKETKSSVTQTLKAEKSVSEKHTLKVVARNYDGDKQIATLEQIFEVIVLPEIEEVDLLKDISVNSGDKVKLAVNIKSEVYQLKYQWYKNSEVIKGENSSNYTFTSSNKGTEQSRDKYSVEVTALYNGNEMSKITYSCIVTVFPAPGVVSCAPQDKVVSVGGKKKIFTVTVAGGNPDGWSYKWYKNSDIISGASSASYTCEFSNNGTDALYDTYKVVVSNVEFSDSVKFKTEIWPTPTVDVAKDLNFYYDESATVQAQVHGGYPGKWTYKWDCRSGQDSSPSFSFVVASASGDSYSDKIILTVKNSSPSDEEWYNKTFEIPYNAWAVPEFSDLAPSKNEYGEGQMISAAIIVNKGNPKGWAFEWKDDEKEIGNESNLNYPAKYDGGNLGYEDHKIRVVATNRTTNKTISDSRTYDVRIWKKAEFPNNILLYDKNRKNNTVTKGIREGNEIHVSVDSPKYGYTEGSPWAYNWSENNKFVGDDRDLGTRVAKINSTGNEKKIETMNYSVSIQNIGPDGSEWASSAINKSISVYRRPKTPSKLVKKGSGVSTTLIATTDGLSDSDLNKFEYYLVFGYDSNGESIAKEKVLQEIGTTRFDKFTAEEFNNSKNRFWVCSLWRYSDGVEITSGKCYLDGIIDEDYDGSTYELSTRGENEASDVKSIFETGELHVENGYLKGHLGTPQSVVVNIYNSSAVLVKTKKYGKATEFFEKLPTEDIAVGLYIVEVIAGNKRTVTKLLNK